MDLLPGSQLLRDYVKYADSVQGRWPMQDPSKQNPNVRSLFIPLLNLFHATPGNRAWKQAVDVVLRDAKSVSEALDRTLHCIPDEALDSPPHIPTGMSAGDFVASLEDLPVPDLESLCPY